MNKSLVQDVGKKTTLCNFTGKNLSVFLGKTTKLYWGKRKVEEKKNLCILKAKKKDLWIWNGYLLSVKKKKRKNKKKKWDQTFIFAKNFHAQPWSALMSTCYIWSPCLILICSIVFENVRIFLKATSYADIWRKQIW